MTRKEIIYLISDELKLDSDDSTFNESHISFLVDKYRAFVLKQRYSDIKKIIPESNYQTVCLSLEKVPAINGAPCEGGPYLRSIKELPHLMPLGNTRISTLDYFQSNIQYISNARMSNVGYNKFLKNIIYSSLAPDNHLYFKSSNPQFLYLEKVRMTAIFEDVEKASELECNDGESICDPMDKEFPIEAALVPVIVELVTKELRASEYNPSDEFNDANDQLDEMNVKK